MKQELMGILVKNLLKEGFKTQEFQKELERHRKHPGLYSCFCQRLNFAFANFKVDMLVEAKDLEAISIDNVRYKIVDTNTNEIVTNET